MFSAARRRRRGWRCRTIFASGWLRPLSSAACRAMRRPSVSGSASRARCAGCSASAPAARFRRLRRAGIAGPAASSASRLSAGSIRRQPDLTLLKIQERLIANCGERFSSSVIWRFLDRHEITFKKRPRMPRSSSARRLEERQEWFGRNSTSIRENSFSSMKRGLPPIWRAKADAADEGDGYTSAFPTATQDRHAGRRPAPFRPRGPEGFR